MWWWRRAVTPDDRTDGSVPAHWAGRDYYRDLGVPPDAGTDQIKRAARRIMRECVPDRDPEDLSLELRFKAASEAKEVLTDDEKRRQYDAYRLAGENADTLLNDAESPQQAAES